jgi:formylmethanofuran dehydrogenase subunit E
MGLKFHGHRCPAMPLGLRAGLAAMRALGVERSANKELFLICENGPAHATMCFLDGAMVATGCTYGKANVIRKNIAKNTIVLIDMKSNRAVRVKPNPEFQKKGLESEFVKIRKSGVPATKVDPEIVNPMIENIMSAGEEDILIVGDVFEKEIILPKGTFEWFECEECGEIVFENRARISGNRKVCVTCSGWDE